MILSLFVVFFALSLILIALGLFHGEHSELALIGFVFLFLISLVIIDGDIQYKSGEQEFYVYGSNLTEDSSHFDNYDPNPTFKHSIDEAKDALLFHKNTTNIYSSMDDVELAGSTLTHLFGYWLGVISIIGFVGVILGLRKSKGYR